MQVRRQGRKGESLPIKFPTLKVRDPNELNFVTNQEVSKKFHTLHILGIDHQASIVLNISHNSILNNFPRIFSFPHGISSRTT